MSRYGWATVDSNGTIKYHTVEPTATDDANGTTYTSQGMQVLDDLEATKAQEIIEAVGTPGVSSAELDLLFS